MSFCFEHLETLKQGPHHYVKGVKYNWTEWRQVDYDNILYHQHALLDWIHEYRGAPRFGVSDYIVRGLEVEWKDWGTMQKIMTGLKITSLL